MIVARLGEIIIIIIIIIMIIIIIIIIIIIMIIIIIIIIIRLNSCSVDVWDEAFRLNEMCFNK